MRVYTWYIHNTYIHTYCTYIRYPSYVQNTHTACSSHQNQNHSFSAGYFISHEEELLYVQVSVCIHTYIHTQALGHSKGRIKEILILELQRRCDYKTLTQIYFYHEKLCASENIVVVFIFLSSKYAAWIS